MASTQNIKARFRRVFHHAFIRSFLSNYQKQFIKHNLNVFSPNRNENGKIILVELNETASSTISYSYIANHLSKKHNAKIVAYKPRLPRNLFLKVVWNLRAIFGFSALSVFNSFGASSFILPSLNRALREESNSIYEEQIDLIHNKYDVEKITVKGILVGDLIYDYYLNFYKTPTIEIESKRFHYHLKFCIQVIVFWDNFFATHEVMGLNTSHTVYSNALPLRIAIKYGCECFQANESEVFRLTKEQVYSYADFFEFKKIFTTLDEKQKSSGIKIAKERIERRLSGEIGLDMSYSQKSAFTPSSKERLLKDNNKIKILLAPHCFFDSPHPFGNNLYPDVFEWLKQLIKISKLTDYDWYVKTHPDFLPKTKKLVNDFFQSHPQFTLLPSDASHLQIVDEGIDFVLTIYGTVGFEYAAMNKPVINASLTNPHIAFDFNINPKSREEYEEVLMNLADVDHKININEVYEYYYMKNIYYNKNWLFSNFDEFTKANGGRANANVNHETYPYWIENWSEKRHEEILASLDKFTASNEYKLIV